MISERFTKTTYFQTWHMKHTPHFLRFMVNLYGPFLGAGLKVDHISADWREIRVSLRLRWYNRNISRTHFGGSLYSMADPHLVLMLMHLLGDDYQPPPKIPPGVYHLHPERRW